MHMNKIMLYHILPFTDTLRSLLRPSSGCPTPNFHTVVLSDVRYSRHFYLTNTYVITMKTVVPNIKCFVYYIHRFIPEYAIFITECISDIQLRSNIKTTDFTCF